MTKLLSSYPNAEYTDLSLCSGSRRNSPEIESRDPLAATKIIQRKARKSPRDINHNKGNAVRD